MTNEESKQKRPYDETLSAGQVIASEMERTAKAPDVEPERNEEWQVWWQGSASPPGAYIWATRKAFGTPLREVAYAGPDNAAAHKIGNYIFDSPINPR